MTDALRSGEAARQTLTLTVTDEPLLARQAELDEAVTAKGNEISEARDLLAVRERRLFENPPDIAKINRRQAEFEKAKWTRRIAESKELIPKLEKELEAIQAEQAKFNEQLLEP